MLHFYISKQQRPHLPPLPKWPRTHCDLYWDSWEKIYLTVGGSHTWEASWGWTPSKAAVRWEKSCMGTRQVARVKDCKALAHKINHSPVIWLLLPETKLAWLICIFSEDHKKLWKSPMLKPHRQSASERRLRPCRVCPQTHLGSSSEGRASTSALTGHTPDKLWQDSHGKQPFGV